MVANCEVCSEPNVCLQCKAGDSNNNELMLNPDGTACVPKIDNCKAAKEIQPIGLTANFETAPYSWYCSDCIEGMFLNQTDLTCHRCDATIANCVACESEFNCTMCDLGYISNERTCDVPNLPNCKTVSNISQHMCAECHEFFTLSHDGLKCIPCYEHTPGCTACAVDAIGTPTACYACADNLYLENNTCHWDECADWTNLDANFNQFSVATCNQCNEFYGVFYSTDGRNNTCVPCYQNMNQGQIWSDCASCSINTTGIPNDCLSCSSSYSLLKFYDGSFPIH